MKDGRYRHVNWPMIVQIEDNCIVEFIRLPPAKHPFTIVWPAWRLMKENKRPFSEEEEDYFIYESDD